MQLLFDPSDDLTPETIQAWSACSLLQQQALWSLYQITISKIDEHPELSFASSFVNDINRWLFGTTWTEEDMDAALQGMHQTVGVVDKVMLPQQPTKWRINRVGWALLVCITVKKDPLRKPDGTQTLAESLHNNR